MVSKDELKNYLNSVGFPNGTIQKRILNEIISILDDIEFLNVSYRNEGTKSYLNISILKGPDIFEFEISSKDYPFLPPNKFIFNKHNYRDFLKIESPLTFAEVKSITNFECLCCSTILCAGNWSPSVRFTDILNEYYRIKTIRRKIVNKLLANKIISRYLLIDDKGFYKYFYSFL